MILISEEMSNQDSLIVEETENKRLHLKGIFLECDVKNKNGRIYRSQDMAKSVDAYRSTMIDNKTALGELNHPESASVNPERACMLTTSLTQQGSDWYGDAITTHTPLGDLVTNLVLRDGVTLGVSSRVIGELDHKTGFVRPDFNIRAIDVVTDPSAPHAFVNGILESQDWIIESKLLSEKQLNKAKYDKEYLLSIRDFINKRLVRL